ncbi:hypothetical protein BDC45DRAFT_515931 [Circinella umbellata]|nr:hypothetical protein BDC45DRAFT_515931 [Circinella umbellata]
MGKQIKSSIGTADSKALHKKARIYLSSLMYANDPEEFDVKWNEFRQCYLVEDITFYTYMFDYYYPKRKKWRKAWREGIHFHTNNLMESWHNQLKTLYFKNKTRKHRIDYPSC